MHFSSLKIIVGIEKPVIEPIKICRRVDRQITETGYHLIYIKPKKYPCFRTNEHITMFVSETNQWCYINIVNMIFLQDSSKAKSKTRFHLFFLFFYFFYKSVNRKHGVFYITYAFTWKHYVFSFIPNLCVIAVQIFIYLVWMQA